MRRVLPSSAAATRSNLVNAVTVPARAQVPGADARCLVGESPAWAGSSRRAIHIPTKTAIRPASTASAATTAHRPWMDSSSSWRLVVSCTVPPRLFPPPTPPCSGTIEISRGAGTSGPARTGGRPGTRTTAEMRGGRSAMTVPAVTGRSSPSRSCTARPTAAAWADRRRRASLTTSRWASNPNGTPRRITAAIAGIDEASSNRLRMPTRRSGARRQPASTDIAVLASSSRKPTSRTGRDATRAGRDDLAR